MSDTSTRVSTHQRPRRSEIEDLTYQVPHRAEPRHAESIVVETVDRPRSPLRRRFAGDRLEPSVRRSVRRLLTVMAMAPLIAILVRELPRLGQDPLLLGYGVAVLTSTLAVFFIAFTRYEDPSDPRFSRVKNAAGAPALAPIPRVSLLVAVMDEIDVIDQCVRSMMDSDYPDLQVIVVDDASTDGTTDVLRELSVTLGFTLVALDQNVGKKHALVQGAALADGDVIAFTDSDCVLAPDALRRCVAALVAHPGLGAVSGHARALNADDTFLTKIQDAWYEGQFRVTKAAEASFGSVTCVSGPLAVFRRDAIYNYFPAWANDRFLGAEFRFATDRQLTGYVLGQKWAGAALKSEFADSPFVKEVDYPERCWKVSYVQSAKVWTVVPPRMRPFLRQQVRWKKSFVRNLFFTGRFMWRRGLGPALLFYGHVLWVLAAPVMAVRHLIWAPTHGLWFITVLYLCGILLKGTAWGLAVLIDNPGSSRWRYRPLMSLASSLVLSWLLVYAILTIRRGIWTRSIT